jgi:hypothetical protein
MKPSVLARIASQLSRPAAIVDAVEATQQRRDVSQVDYMPPQDDVEAGVAEIWARLLRVGRVGRADDFFLLGGQSLIATQMISRLWERFGVELTIDPIFTNTTVETFSNVVRTAMATGSKAAPISLTTIVRPTRIPLSFGQQRLWIAHHVSSARGLFNHPLALRFKGPLDVEHLRAAIQKLVDRHEVLRTCFTESDGLVEQTILHDVTVDLPLEPLALNPGEVESAAYERQALAEAARPFDLARDIPFRTLLLRAHQNDHLLVIVAHHIATDGWSDHIMLGELCRLYETLSQRQSPDLAPLPIQYADYAVWQRKTLEGERLHALQAYWRGQLAGAVDVVAMPTDRKRPAEPNFTGGQINLAIPPPLTRKLEELCREQRCSIFMLLCAAFMLLISGITGQDDLIIGTDLANRKGRELEGLIGFFVNVLPLRARISGDPTFVEFLKNVRATALGAYAHQEMPFDKIVEDASPGRSSGHNPLVQVIFVMQNTPPAPLNVTGLEIEQVSLPVRHSRFDLGVFAKEVGGRLILDWQYSSEIFETATVASITEDYASLLEGIAEAPHKHLSALPAKRRIHPDFDIPKSEVDRQIRGQRLKVARRRTTKV